mmetsp:Transcript_33055/g.77305  ORF Transcript_33055/g.77305 Transcript_33055/m.77305 type:complete len:291 (+) Transcript_33055:149-1021(+)
MVSFDRFFLAEHPEHRDAQLVVGLQASCVKRDVETEEDLFHIISAFKNSRLADKPEETCFLWQVWGNGLTGQALGRRLDGPMRVADVVETARGEFRNLTGCELGTLAVGEATAAGKFWLENLSAAAAAPGPKAKAKARGRGKATKVEIKQELPGGGAIVGGSASSSSTAAPSAETLAQKPLTLAKVYSAAAKDIGVRTNTVREAVSKVLDIAAKEVTRCGKARFGNSMVLKLHVKPAQPEREGYNFLTKKRQVFKARPEMRQIRLKALKKFKDKVVRHAVSAEYSEPKPE